MDAFMSMITAFGCNFIIRNWGACAGGLVSINQNQALYSLIGTFFGGDGRTTFGLPELRGRSPVNYGNGPGLNPVTMGMKGGLEYSQISVLNLPPHDHTVTLSGATAATSADLPVSSAAGFATDPDGNYLATTNSSNRIYTPTLSSPAGTMGPIAIPGQTVVVSGTTNYTGSGQQFYTRSPYQGVNYQICMFGIYPSRS